MKDHSKYYNELNDRQKLAVDTIDGPLLVLAGPGTGKTQLLSVRAASILKSVETNPENILILTYTNSASKAMKERLAKIIGPEGYDIEVGTFHSFANSIIQDSEEAANYVADKILMDEVERMRVIEYILDNTNNLEDIRPFRAPYTYLKEILQKISELKKDNVEPDDLARYLDSDKSYYRQMDEKYIKRLKAFAIVYRLYEELKQGKNADIFDERGRYDFDDMILFATKALRNEKDLRGEFQDKYKYVMVDEFQDTNGAQLELLFTLLGRKNPNLLCVGDDDQSIYRFQGASVGNFKLLEERFSGIKKISLKNNYRSTEELLKMSGKIISGIPQKERAAEKELSAVREWSDKEIVFKELSTQEEELCYIVDKVKELKDRIEKDPGLSAEERSRPYNNIAILVRKRTQILKIIDAFLRAGIPYATDGKENISGEKRVRQLLDVLELAHMDPKEYDVKDLSFYKVLSSDYFRIPNIDIMRFVSYVNNKKSRKDVTGVTLLGEFLTYFPSGCKDVKFEEEDRMVRAYEAIKRLLDDAATRSVHTILMDFIKDSGIFTYVLKEYDGNKGILRIRELRSLGSFVNMVKASDMAKPAIRLNEFMAELKTRNEHELGIQGNLVTLTQTGVRVYTAHGSKGLEFHSVIIPFCLQNKNWPARPMAEKIALPFDLFKAKEQTKDKNTLKQLTAQDEIRLFYVAMTRARSNLIFTASPAEDAVSSSYLKDLDIKKEGPDQTNEEELIDKSLEVTDLKDPFIGTEEVLKDMISNLSLNPTRINNYITCPRKFAYNDILKLPGAKKKSLVFGNCVHKALEETYKKFKDTGIFPTFDYFCEAFNKELKFQGVDTVMTHDCLEKLKTLKEWFDAASRNPILPIGLENKLRVTVGENIIFTGKYDKVEWEDEKKGLVRIIDYKTGKPDRHLKEIDECADLASPDCDGYFRQLVCYKLLFERDKKESKGRKVSHGVLVFIEPVSDGLVRKGYRKGEYATKYVKISDKMVEDLEKLIKNVWKDICDSKFDKLKERDGDICGNCDFDTACWG